MKYSLLALFMLCLATGVFAQHGLADWQPVIEKSVSHPTVNTVSKTTSLTQRLSAIATYKPGTGPGTILTDSVTYKYYGIRSSHFDFNALRYFDSSNLTNILFDTAVHYKNVSSGMMPSSRVGGEYLASDQLLAQVSQVPVSLIFFQNIQSDSFFYNANHTIARQRHFTWPGVTVFDTVSDRLYSYNTQGLINQDVIYSYAGNLVFNAASRSDYVYNAAGKQDTVTSFVYTPNIWTATSRIFFDYYPGNLLRAYTIQNYVGTAWVNMVKDSVGYGAFNIYNYYQEQTWNGSQWINAIKDVRHENAQGIPDTQYVSYWNNTTLAYNAPTVTAWQYDSTFRPTRSIQYDSTGNFADSMRYYYEIYNNPVAVPVINMLPAIVYPNPATGVLYIRWDAANGAPDNVRILNAQGQVVKTSNTKDDAETTIQVADLAPGVYWIRGVNKDGKEDFQASFLKQ